jgi:hypothetical protein
MTRVRKLTDIMIINKGNLFMTRERKLTDIRYI